MQVIKIFYIVLITLGMLFMSLGAFYLVTVLFGQAMAGDKFIAAAILGVLGVIGTSIGVYNLGEGNRYGRW